MLVISVAQLNVMEKVASVIVSPMLSVSFVIRVPLVSGIMVLVVTLAVDLVIATWLVPLDPSAIKHLECVTACPESMGTSVTRVPPGTGI